MTFVPRFKNLQRIPIIHLKWRMFIFRPIFVNVVHMTVHYDLEVNGQGSFYTL